jgi:hypothetical protein
MTHQKGCVKVLAYAWLPSLLLLVPIGTGSCACALLAFVLVDAQPASVSWVDPIAGASYPIAMAVVGLTSWAVLKSTNSSATKRWVIAVVIAVLAGATLINMAWLALLLTSLRQ